MKRLTRDGTGAIRTTPVVAAAAPAPEPTPTQTPKTTSPVPADEDTPERGKKRRGRMFARGGMKS